MTEHSRHTILESALAADCYYGECEHIDENGEPEDFSACPRVPTEVCIDCMVEQGQGEDPDHWENLAVWPHKSQDEPLPSMLSAPLAILKPPPLDVVCGHGFDHHDGPHACDRCQDGDSCPYWAWVADHNRAVARIAAEVENREGTA